MKSGALQSSPLRVGVLGLGGLGQAAARLLAPKKEMTLVAVADRHGYLYSPDGIDVGKAIAVYSEKGSVGHSQSGNLSDHSIGDLIGQAEVDLFFGVAQFAQYFYGGCC